jgi:hypothetical protein
VGEEVIADAMTDPLIPTSKFDDAAVERLRQSEPAQVAAVAFEVLAGIMGPNWPISQDLEDLLILHVNTIRQGLLKVLRGNDAE